MYARGAERVLSRCKKGYFRGRSESSGTKPSLPAGASDDPRQGGAKNCLVRDRTSQKAAASETAMAMASCTAQRRRVPSWKAAKAPSQASTVM